MTKSSKTTMKTTLKTILFVILLSACSTQPTQIISQPSSTSTAQPILTPAQHSSATLVPSVTVLIEPTSTPKHTTNFPTRSPVETTLRVIGKICTPPARDQFPELSPDGKWIAVVCLPGSDEIDSYLRVASIQGDDQWDIKYADYTIGPWGWGYEIHPFHWSVDGKYLYATSDTRGSGGYWIGPALLLVRLTLENGQQTEIYNDLSEENGRILVDYRFSPSDRYLLYTRTDKNNLFILDLYTWEQRAIPIRFENTGAGYALMSNDETKVVLMLIEYPEVNEGDLTYGSLVLFDLENGTQKKLVSGLLFEETPRPAQWLDDETVVLSGFDGKSWTLNIHTAEMQPTK